MLGVARARLPEVNLSPGSVPWGHASCQSGKELIIRQFCAHFVLRDQPCHL